MAETRSTESPLAAAAGAAGPRATEAFELLGNETRLAILLALWERYDPHADDDAVSFSELFDRVDYDDAGNFSYHLEKLEGQFVRKRDDGYELRDTGLELVKEVIGGAGVQDASLEPAEIDRPCRLCGARTAVAYDDGVLYHVCTECDGNATDRELPEGYLNSMKFHPAGLTDRSPEELLAAAEVAAYRHMRTMYEGLCSACSGPVESSLEVCSDHESDGVCANCGLDHAIWVSFECLVCKDHHRTTPAVLSELHPAVNAFYYDHGVAPPRRADEVGDLTPVEDCDPEYETTITSEDPPRVAVTIALDGDELRLTYDETVSVVGVTR